MNLLRPFEVAPPAVLMTSADSTAAAPPAANELFLPVGDEVFARPFDRGHMSRPAVLDTFRSRVAPPHTAAFDKGVTALAAGDYGVAESSFKTAITPTDDSTAALTYLAATFAASGHDREAASAWETALIDGAGIPEIYQWLGDTLLRVHDLPHARAVLEEAVGKWPADPRFAKPLAMLYATMGLGREAVRTMQRHLEAAADRRRRPVHGRRMDLQPAHAQRRGAVAAGRREDRPDLRRGLRAREGAAGGAREAMDRVPRPGTNHPAAVIPLLAWLALATQAWGQDQRPRFQAGVDITSVDVSVVDSDGRPVQGLARADFNVRIGGARAAW